jgi:multisubunit Na+/H+ antiporter MnhF subunit
MTNRKKYSVLTEIATISAGGVSLALLVALVAFAPGVILAKYLIEKDK